MGQFEVIIRSVKEPQRRIEINISRLSQMTGYSVSHLSRFIAGKTRPTMKCWVEVASALGIGLDELKNLIDNRGIRHGVKTY